VLGDDADGASAAPIDNDPVSPMKTLAGGALNTESEAGPTIAPQNTISSSARAT